MRINMKKKNDLKKKRWGINYFIKLDFLYKIYT